uniref:RING-type E3 ubiquitin transferase n=1 Tax=Arion vulgaris TaxID=1028688 RepID=A0A0B6XY22_9EUPU
MFRPAGTAEIIRSHQKDDNFLSLLRSSFADICQRIAGPRVWIQWRKHLDVTADLAYFCLTTLSDLQTVGEEYVNIIQTDKSLRTLPSKWRRALMLALQVCAPYIVQATLDKLERHVQDSSPSSIRPTTREAVLSILPLIRKAVTILHRIHLMMFYINGIFYHLSKRVAGIHYIQYMSRERDHSSLRPFQILGYLSVFQLFSSFVINLVLLVTALRRQRQSSHVSSSLSDVETETDHVRVMPNEKCPLCLGRRRRSTLTPCGHLYCWSCIHEWCLSKQECPLCRDQFPSHRLIVLQNYDST